MVAKCDKPSNSILPASRYGGALMEFFRPDEIERQKTRVIYSRGDCGDHVADLKLRLRKAGYVLKEMCSCLVDSFCEHMQIGVFLYQKFFRLPLSGRIDLQMLKHISRKRCACADIQPDVV